MNVTQTQTVRSSSMTSLWLAWVVATFVGTVLGSLLAFPIGWSIGGAVDRIGGDTLARAVVGLVMGTLLFGTIALAQAVVLRGRVPAGRRWVLYSVLAGALGMGMLMLLMTDIVEAASSVIVPMAVFGFIGLCLGVAQWLVLRHYAARAAWWVLISSIAVGLAFVGLFLIGGEGRELLTLITTGIILGVVSGTGLVWLLRGNGTANP